MADAVFIELSQSPIHSVTEMQIFLVQRSSNAIPHALHSKTPNPVQSVNAMRDIILKPAEQQKEPQDLRIQKMRVYQLSNADMLAVPGHGCTLPQIGCMRAQSADLEDGS